MLQIRTPRALCVSDTPQSSYSHFVSEFYSPNAICIVHSTPHTNGNLCNDDACSTRLTRNKTDQQLCL